MLNQITILARLRESGIRAPVALHALSVRGSVWRRAGRTETGEKIRRQRTSETPQLRFGLVVTLVTASRAVVATSDKEALVAWRRQSVLDPNRHVASGFETSVARRHHFAVLTCQSYRITVVTCTTPRRTVYPMLKLNALLAGGLPACPALVYAGCRRVRDAIRL